MTYCVCVCVCVFEAHFLSSVAFRTGRPWCLQTGNAVTLCHTGKWRTVNDDSLKRKALWRLWWSVLWSFLPLCTPNVSVKTKETRCEQKRHWACFMCLYVCVCVCVSVCYHRRDDAFNGLIVYDGSALAQVHSHEVPPVDRRWRVGDLPQPCLFNVFRCGHHKHPDALVASPFCRHFDAPARVSSHVAVSDDHSKSESLGVWGCAQHFVGHVGEGAVDVGALTQVTDSIDTLETE